MQSESTESHRAQWHRLALAAAAATLLLAAVFGWLSWATVAALALGALAGTLIGRAANGTRRGRSDAGALLHTLDQNLKQIGDETSRAIALSRDAAKEIERCFRKWEEALDESGGVADLLESARATSCEIIRLLQFEDISSQALNISLEGLAECRDAIQRLQAGKIGIEEVERRLRSWQHRRRADAQSDMSAGSTDFF